MCWWLIEPRPRASVSPSHSVVRQTADSGGEGGKMTRGVRITDWSVRGCRSAARRSFRGYHERYYKSEVTDTDNRRIRIRKRWHFCCKVRRHLTIGMPRLQKRIVGGCNFQIPEYHYRQWHARRLWHTSRYTRTPVWRSGYGRIQVASIHAG